MKELIKKVLTDKSARDRKLLKALAVALVVVGSPWG